VDFHRVSKGFKGSERKYRDSHRSALDTVPRKASGAEAPAFFTGTTEVAPRTSRRKQYFHESTRRLRGKTGSFLHGERGRVGLLLQRGGNELTHQDDGAQFNQRCWSAKCTANQKNLTAIFHAGPPKCMKIRFRCPEGAEVMV